MDTDTVYYKILEFIKNTKKESAIVEEKLDLTSLQTLLVVAEIEKYFGVQIEDNKIFRGLFSSMEVITDYVNDKCDVKSS